MKKKILKAVAVLALLIIIIIAAVMVLLVRKPNILFDIMSQEITEGEVKEISFEYEYDEDAPDDDDNGQPATYGKFPVFKFTAPESAGYIVSVTDVKSDADVFISMSVVDEELEDVVSADNYDTKMGGLTDSITTDVPMQESHQSYILIETSPGNESVTKYSGSFRVSVTKAAEEEKPPVITAGETVKLKVAADAQSCAVFVPQETGYYRFSSSMVNSRSGGGYSEVSSVTSKDKLDIGLTDGICMLEEGKEYYVWVAVYETAKKSSRVKLSCAEMARVITREKGEIPVEGAAVIEFQPSEFGNIAVYSVSNGDPKAMIYEKAGFPLRTDDDSEASLSDNPDDFALVFTAEAGTIYRICVSGDFTEGSVIITDYTGDGSSLTSDDVAPLTGSGEDEESEPEAETETEATENIPLTKLNIVL